MPPHRRYTVKNSGDMKGSEAETKTQANTQRKGEKKKPEWRVSSDQQGPRRARRPEMKARSHRRGCLPSQMLLTGQSERMISEGKGRASSL